MQHHLILPLLCCFAGFLQNAHAVSRIDKSQAVAGPRSSAGTGVCGSVAHFASAQPLMNKADAVAILNKPTTDPAILGRTARLFDNINFRNGQPNTDGDFVLPSYRDEVLPYSLDPMATPMGTDFNITLRLRGYFNVPTTLAGKTISFGLNCDDYCSLTIGTTTVFPAVDAQVSARVIKQVLFSDPGLYPIELVYFQNKGPAYLEWARTDAAVPECPSDLCTTPLTDPGLYMGQFKLVQKSELYSAIVGENPGCQECGTPGMSCSTGNYCGDGLCQSCNTPAHCGPSCITCPAAFNLCSAGRCVQCVADDQCPPWQTCDIPNGKCASPKPCSGNTDCATGQVCDLGTNLCTNPSRPCTLDSMCPPGQTCDTVKQLCKTPPKMCDTDAACGDTTVSYCEVSIRLCKYRAVNTDGGATDGGAGDGGATDGGAADGGGQVGCSCRAGQGQGPGQAAAATGMLALLVLFLAHLGLRSRRRSVG